MIEYKFDPGTSSFFKTLRKKVNHYFIEHKVHPAGDAKLYLKALLQVLSAAVLYLVLVFFTPPTPVAILLCMILGLNLAVLGFNVMHEGAHQTFSRFPWLNSIAAYSLNLLGASIYFWKKKHNINHHTYTNIEGMDSDIDVKPFMRFHEGQPLRSFHRFQHIYWVVLYGLSYLTWIFYFDFRKYFSGKISANANKENLPVKEHFIFWCTKLFYMGVYMVIPILIVGWVPWLIGFLIMTFTCGLATSIVFQLAHVVEVTEFHSAQDQHTRQEWAIHQLVSTANFATTSKSLYWLLGGLNFQIEHHLFPRISHIHYPEISPIIKETCKKYNIAYREYTSMFRAIVSHLIHLRRLGTAVNKVNRQSRLF